MANQPPVRPWFRLGSIRAATIPPPPPPSAPAPPPESRPIMSLPAFRTASAPSSPQIQPRDPTPPPPPPEPLRVSAPSSPPQTQRYSAPSSPLQKPPHTTNSSSLPSSPSRKPTATSSPHSPRTITQAVTVTHTPMRSPKLNPSAPPPSPLTLPPSQVRTDSNFPPPPEAEPKTVLVQKTVDKPRQYPNGGDFHREAGEPRHHGNNSHHHGKHVEANKEKSIHRKLSETEESGMRVITIAGENRGAYMELIQSQKKKHDPNTHLHKKGGDGSESSSSGGEGKERNTNKGRSAAASSSSLPVNAYMNSNVQSVNNSLLYNTSCSHHDPGVKLSLTKKPFSEGYHLKERVDGRHNV